MQKTSISRGFFSLHNMLSCNYFFPSSISYCIVPTSSHTFVICSKKLFFFCNRKRCFISRKMIHYHLLPHKLFFKKVFSVHSTEKIDSVNSQSNNLFSNISKSPYRGSNFCCFFKIRYRLFAFSVFPIL